MENSAPDPRVRALRHSFRGHVQNVILMAHALELCDGDDERLEYLDNLIKATDDCVATLQELQKHLSG